MRTSIANPVITIPSYRRCRMHRSRPSARTTSLRSISPCHTSMASTCTNQLLMWGGRPRPHVARTAPGQAITVYGQHEVLKDLIKTRLEAGGQLLFDTEGVSVHDLENRAPKIRFRREGAAHELTCDFIAGCDGSHGVCRPSIPAGVLTLF